MSADNGIYIAKFPTKSGGVEWRVAYASAIDNCDLDYMGTRPERKTLEDAYRLLYFGDVKVFDREEDAILYAHKRAKEVDYLEYGVSHLTFDRCLPDYPRKEAMRIVSAL